MLSIRRIVVLICLIAGPFVLRAQFVNYGTDPARYKWNIVHTEHYKIIYPQQNDSMAYRYAQLLETTYPFVEQTIGKSRKWKFPVVLHPSNMLSNGMVAWAPRRMELITTPSADNTAQAWDSHLVLHEGRHVFQTRKFMEGMFRPLYFLVGEQISGISNLAVPTWFLEGDAVVTETALSGSGRGRLPEFNMTYRAQMQSGDFYSFDKWFLGSYKDYSASKYAMGYDMVAFARREYGADIWDKTTTRYIKRFLNIPPFTKAFKHYTGIGRDHLFDNTFAFLRDEWEKQDQEHRRSGFNPDYLLPEPTVFSTYNYPLAINDSTVVALKSSLKEISSIVTISGGKEKRLTHVGNVNSKLLHANGKLFWTEYTAGLRWSHENYSVLKCYNLATGKTTILTPRRRYLAPAINASAQQAAVAEFSETGKNSIILLDAGTGNELRSFETPDNAFVKDLTFGRDNELFATAVSDNGISIWRLNLADARWQIVLEPTKANVNPTYWHNGKLYVESGLNGTNNVYTIDTENGQTQRLTTARFGAFTPTLSADKRHLLFADYQKTGYRIASVPMDRLNPQPADFTSPYRFALAEEISRQENFNADTVQLQEIDFQPKRYSKLLNLLKVHSWAPIYYDVSDIINMDVDDFTTIVKPGAMLISQNSLNTAVTQLGWYYKDRAHHGKIDFTYTGWYPVIDLSATYGNKAFKIGWTSVDEENEVLSYQYSDKTLFEAEARVYIPFNLTRNHYIRGIQPSLTYYFTNNRIQQYANRKYSYFQYLMPELRFYSYRRMAPRDILPRLGYQFRLQQLTPLSTGDIYGELYAARLTTYLPGLAANNSLMIRLGYQYQRLNGKTMYIPEKIIDSPRGYNYSIATHQLMDVKADYAFALAYPDWSMGSIAYIKRVRTNLFFDMAFNQRNQNASWDNYGSAGFDLIVDWHALQTEFPLSLGLRLAKPFEEDGLHGELLFSISF